MTFDEVLDAVIALLQRQKRVSYRALKRRLQLDDADIEDIKAELIAAQQLASDENDTVLVWTGGPSSPLSQPKSREHPLLASMPQHLAEKILTSRAALEGERKQVTVLFADIKGSTELIEGLDPEAVRNLLDPVLHTMMDAVHRYEGMVNQVLGDGIMALFGAPLAHEDHAVRACYAALAMQKSMRQYTEEVRRTAGIVVQIRLGLNSGEVVVRAIGNDLHMDYSAIGQTTHLAARMEQLATPGSILLTAATLRLVEGFVHVTPLGPVPIKGLAAPVEVFELVSASRLRRRLQAAAMRGLTRFVGRQQELKCLQQTQDKAQAGQGQLVAVMGEPGVGKSRLYYEFVHSHRSNGWLILESSAVSYGKAVAYLPVVELLKVYFQIEEGDDGRRIREKVTGKLLTLDEQLRLMLPAFLALLTVPVENAAWQALDPPQRRQRILEAWAFLLQRESQEQPLVLVFEDLHWIDTETQACLDSLIEAMPSQRILLLVNYRPEYQPPWAGQPHYTQLRLEALPRASAEALLQTLLGDDPRLTPLKQLLIARTDGNPFFLEESVQTLVETQVLVGQQGAYRLTQDVPTIQVPATVQSVLAARIDRLPLGEKRLLQTAAVIGTEVPFSLLRAIADLPDATLHLRLAHVQAAGFLYETSLFPERIYTFKHTLTHEVAYGSLLHERRYALHARIVTTLEALAGDRLDDQVERLAYHALRGELWDKAARYFRQAGAKAMARSAYREAVTCFDQALVALDALPDSPSRSAEAIDARFELRNALLSLEEFPRLLDTLCEAETLAEALGDKRRQGRVASFMSSYFHMMGLQERAIVCGQRALTLARACGDAALEVTAVFYLGSAHLTLGNYQRAGDFFRRNVAALAGDQLYERFGMTTLPAVSSRGFLAQCLAELGDFPAAIAVIEEGRRIAETINHPDSLFLVSWNVGLLYVRQGDVPQAITELEHGWQLYRSARIPLFFASLSAALGYALALSNRTSEGIPLLEQAVAKSRVVSWQSLWLTCLSEAYLLAERHDDAIHSAQQALTQTLERQERGMQAWVLRLHGAIYLQGALDLSRAADYYQQALTLATDLSMRPLQAHCHLGLGRIDSQRSQVESAQAALMSAVALYRAMVMPHWLSQAEMALQQLRTEPLAVDVSPGSTP